MIREHMLRDRAGEGAGAGGMGPQSPSLPARRRQIGLEWERLPGDRYEVGGGQRTHPPAPAASPARREYGTCANDAR